MNQANVSSILNKTYLKPNEKSLTYEESESIKEKDQIENPHELHDSRIIPSRDKNSKLMKKLAQANEEIEVKFLKIRNFSTSF